MPKKYSRRITDPETRFWSHVAKSEDCWTWELGRNPKGYGHFYVSKSVHTIQAHRFSWVLVNGEVPPGLFVLHRCDNPPCVRPDHLWLGTARDNTHDMLAKGRGKKRSLNRDDEDPYD